MSARLGAPGPAKPPQAKPPSLRVFVAVPLPEALRQKIHAMTAVLAPRLPDMKWLAKIENLHVTLKFLGQVASTRIDELAAALAAGLRDQPSFDVEVRGLGAFRSPGHASVIWAGVRDPAGGLQAAARMVEEATRGLGAAVEEPRPFRPHITLGRSKQGVDARAALEGLADHAFGAFGVNDVHLYESQPGRGGSTYVVRALVPLDHGQ